MESYSDFAALYDEFMEGTPYDEWSEFIIERLRADKIEDGLVCDLGAGTGEMTRRLRDAGYDMIGIDNSEAMLLVARQKEEADSTILYLEQDMRSFELYGTVKAIISVCDSVNYILDIDELTECFRLCNNYLDPKGLLIFDFNTRYKYETVIGETTIAENREDCSFIWDNYYDSDEEINEYDITFFVREGDLFRRFEETHFQRGYTLDQMLDCIKKSGLDFVEAIDADTYGQVTDESERIYIVARENGK